MNQSIFAKYVERFFPQLQTIIQLFNGKRSETEALKYYHKDTSIMRREYAPDNKWETDTVNTSYVAADIVDADSPLPIKNRDTLGAASGKLPKIGAKRILKESDINMLNVMEAQGGNAAEIRRRLVNDSVFCSTAIDERNEYSFLAGLSNGYVAVKDDEKSGTLLRINYQYKDDHKFGVQTAGEVTITDLRNAIEQAEEQGNTIIKIWIAKSTYDALRATDEARQLVVDYKGQVIVGNATLPIPTPKSFNEAFADEFDGVTFEVVNRSIKVEKNGKRTSEKPFNPNNVILASSTQLGALVYGRVAEQTNPAPQVAYSVVDTYKLISKYSLLDPYSEITAGQAYALPVIEDIEGLYMISLDKSVAVDETAETADTSDEYVTVDGVKYKKAEFIALLKGYVSIRTDASDTTVISKYNSLSDEAKADLIANAASIVVTD